MTFCAPKILTVFRPANNGTVRISQPGSSVQTSLVAAESIVICFKDPELPVRYVRHFSFLKPKHMAVLDIRLGKHGEYQTKYQIDSEFYFLTFCQGMSRLDIKIYGPSYTRSATLVSKTQNLNRMRRVWSRFWMKRYRVCLCLPTSEFITDRTNDSKSKGKLSRYPWMFEATSNSIEGMLTHAILTW